MRADEKGSSWLNRTSILCWTNVREKSFFPFLLFFFIYRRFLITFTRLCESIHSEPRSTHFARTAHANGGKRYAGTSSTFRNRLQYVVSTKHWLRIGDKRMGSDSTRGRYFSKFGIQIQHQSGALLQKSFGERWVNFRLSKKRANRGIFVRSFILIRFDCFRVRRDRG